jgi:hypothetical protein
MRHRVAALSALTLSIFSQSCTDDTASSPAGLRREGRGDVAAAVAADSAGCRSTGHCRFSANGDYGHVDWFAGDSVPRDSSGVRFGEPRVMGMLDVSRNGQDVFLSYFIQECDATRCTFASGSGIIPSGDLSRGGRDLHLSTNTATNPNFFTFGGLPGVVTVDWEQNGVFEQRTHGTSWVSSGSVTVRSTGQWSSYSAAVRGTIVGRAILPRAMGNIGSTRNVSIEITR